MIADTNSGDFHAIIINMMMNVTFQKPYLSMIASTNLIITVILSGIDTFPLCFSVEWNQKTPMFAASGFFFGFKKPPHGRIFCIV
ncbi:MULTISPECIES: hypothetical protein [unclassified Acinetobacter]|uniref:hypothetical protein n=1 Tax=unclassified Acinetobacter TaxID=196816 RepID=UPI0015D2E563|nr:MULTISPECIES: hypothetical protein [unclassified Acinetobacter]